MSRQVCCVSDVLARWTLKNDQTYEFVRHFFDTVIYLFCVDTVCFYHIRRLHQIRHLVSREVLTQLVTSLVLSRLDYCNAVLAGLPASTLAPLQHA